MGVEPEKSDGIFEMLCSEAVGGITGSVLLKKSKGFSVGD